MGKKKLGALTAGLLVLSLSTQTVSALNVVELYDSYGIEYKIKYPGKTLETIRKYNESQKSVYKYHYVEAADFDKSRLQMEIERLEERKQNLTADLLNGYDTDLDSIYLLEDTYTETERNLQNAKDSLKSKDIKVEDKNLHDVPTDYDYKVSLSVKDIYDARANLGDTIKPVNTACIVKDANDDRIVFLTVRDSAVHPIWKGKVVNVTDTNVVIYHYNGVYTMYSGLYDISIEKDSKVTQETVIGFSGKELTMQLRLDGKFVDCSKLYNGGE